MRRTAVLVLFVVASGWVSATAPPASAHAVLVSSEPADGAALEAPPSVVTLAFSEKPDPELSDISVFDSSGTNRVRGELRSVPGRPVELTAELSDLPDGVYTVSWRAFSTVDGHLTGGAFAFGIGVSPDEITQADVTQPDAPKAGWPEMSGRFFLYVGLTVLAGAAWVAAFAFDSPVTSIRLLALAGGVTAAGGLTLLAAAQWRTSSAALGAFLGTAVGTAFMGRAALLGAALAALALSRRVWRPALILTGAFAAAAVFAHAAAGHAATGSFGQAKVFAQGVHMLAAGVWIGGLIALLTGVRGVPSEAKSAAVRRYSNVALIALLAVASTGTWRAVNEVGSWQGLIGTSYGHAVLVKAVLLLFLAVLGAVNRYRSVPRSPATLRPLRRVSAAEIALAVAAFGLAAFLASAVPSRSAVEAAPAAAVSAQGTDFARTVAVELEATPGLAGLNSFALTLTDPDSGQPIDARRVSLRFEPTAGMDVEASTLTLEREDGRWTGRGAGLAVPGVWRVVVVVQREATGVEIPLTVATRCETTAIEAEDAPTLHDAEIGEGRTVQAYVDPGRPGTNEVHFTFFDASGQELIITGTVVMTARRGDDVFDLEVRRFSPGHYVGGGELAGGEWRFEVDVDEPDGRELATCFTETIE